MGRTVQFIQKAACMGRREDWYAPWIDVSGKWRVIKNRDLVEHPGHLNAHDFYKDAVFRIQKVMEKLGWTTQLSREKQDCHEHLFYMHFTLKCSK